MNARIKELAFAIWQENWAGVDTNEQDTVERDQRLLVSSLASAITAVQDGNLEELVTNITIAKGIIDGMKDTGEIL